MKLTGKCKQDFEKWFFDRFDYPTATIPFYGYWYKTHPSMQWGVYVDFFDSMGIYISVMSSCSHNIKFKFYSFDVCIEGNGFCIDIDDIKTRQEARQKAIEKANEIYNENTK